MLLPPKARLKKTDKKEDDRYNRAMRHYQSLEEVRVVLLYCIFHPVIPIGQIRMLFELFAAGEFSRLFFFLHPRYIRIVFTISYKQIPQFCTPLSINVFFFLFPLTRLCRFHLVPRFVFLFSLFVSISLSFRFGQSQSALSFVLQLQLLVHTLCVMEFSLAHQEIKLKSGC